MTYNKSILSLKRAGSKNDICSNAERYQGGSRHYRRRFIGGMLYAGGQACSATVQLRLQWLTVPNSLYGFLSGLFQCIAAAAVVWAAISRADAGPDQYYALDQLINQQLLYQAAENAKIKVEEAAVNERYQAIQDSYSSKELFEQDLKASGLTASSLKTMLRDSLKIEKLQEEVVKGVEVTDAEVKAAFEEVNARHILIRPEDEGEEAREAALQRAKALMMS